MEYKQSRLMTKSEFENLIAGLEFAKPNLRRQLPWSRATLKGWQIYHKPRHTRPLGRALARLFCIFMVSLGAPDLGIGIMVQRECGMRPSELLGLQEGDISFPEDRGGGSEPIAVIALGVRKGTKAKREQAVVLRDARLAILLRMICRRRRRGDRIFAYSYTTYRRLINKIENQLQLNIGLTPHSPRAGMASEAILAGYRFQDIKEAGRWIVDSSLRTYIDVVSVLQIQTDLETRGLSAMLKYADEQLLAFFPSANGSQRDDGASWPLPGAGREVLPTVGRIPWARSRELSPASASSAQSGDTARRRSG